MADPWRIDSAHGGAALPADRSRGGTPTGSPAGGGADRDHRGWRVVAEHVRIRFGVLFVAAAITGTIIYQFTSETWRVPFPKPQVTYITSLDPNRSDAEIAASNAANQKVQDARAPSRPSARTRHASYRALGRAAGMDVDAIERKRKADSATKRAGAAVAASRSPADLTRLARRGGAAGAARPPAEPPQPAGRRADRADGQVVGAAGPGAAAGRMPKRWRWRRRATRRAARRFTSRSNPARTAASAARPAPIWSPQRGSRAWWSAPRSRSAHRRRGHRAAARARDRRGAGRPRPSRGEPRRLPLARQRSAARTSRSSSRCRSTAASPRRRREPVDHRRGGARARPSRCARGPMRSWSAAARCAPTRPRLDVRLPGLEDTQPRALGADPRHRARGLARAAVPAGDRRDGRRAVPAGRRRRAGRRAHSSPPGWSTACCSIARRSSIGGGGPALADIGLASLDAAQAGMAACRQPPAWQRHARSLRARR